MHRRCRCEVHGRRRIRGRRLLHLVRNDVGLTSIGNPLASPRHKAEQCRRTYEQRCGHTTDFQIFS